MEEDALNQHDAVMLMRPPRAKNVTFLLSTALAILVVLGGWVATVYQDIRGHLGETRHQITEGVSAAASIREETAASRQSITESLGEAQSIFQPFVEATVQQDAAMQVLSDQLKSELSAPASEEEPEAPIDQEETPSLTDTDSE